MPLQTLGEDTILELLDKSETQPLGHSTAYGVPANDTPSIFSHSTNSTASNLPGPGRVLGNFYSVTGRRLERTLGDLAHRAGFGPEAIYQQITTLYLEDGQTDDKKASKFQKLCFKLFEHTRSVTNSTRFRAIMRWRDILRDQHEIYVRLYFSQQELMVKHAGDLLRIIDEFRSTSDLLSGYEDDVFSETSLLIDCHSVGLNIINLNRTRLLVKGGNIQVDWTGVTDIHREEIEKWDVSFKYLLESLFDPTISESSWWYIDFWSSQIVEGNMHLQIALQSCRTLQCFLDSGVVDPTVNFYRWNSLAILGKRIHDYFVGRTHPRAMQLALCDDFLPCGGVSIHISTILINLVQSYNRVYSDGLDIVPDLTCITMLGSTDLISTDVKKKIRGFLKGLRNVNKGKDKAFTKLMFLRSCYRLLRRALSELDDTECFDKLSNVTSFTDGTGRWAILQLGDILQSLPEVYILLITLGGDELRNSVESIRQSLKVSDNSTYGLARYPGILMDLRSLLACHAAGMCLASEDMFIAWPPEVNEFIAQTAPFDNEDFCEAREHFVPYLTDNMTFNPLIFYIKYCISMDQRIDHSSYGRVSFLLCAILQGALLMESRVPQENRSTMEELCRSTQNSVIEQWRSDVEPIGIKMDNVGHALRSVYRDLTESRQTFEDEAEAYLSQMCDLIFKIMSKAQYKWWDRHDAIIELSRLFEFRNVFGWFLSIRGPDAVDSISRLLEDIDDSQIFKPEDSERSYKRPFLHLKVHILGVELLAPRHEKLHFEGDGLTKHLPTRTVEPPLTPEQRERWIHAFKTLATNLSSEDTFNESLYISLFYFANCPLPFEVNPLLDTTIAVDYCERPFSSRVSYSHLSYETYGICSTVMQGPDGPPTFYGTPFDIPKVIEVLNDLAKSSKEKLGDRAPELLPTPHY